MKYVSHYEEGSQIVRITDTVSNTTKEYSISSAVELAEGSDEEIRGVNTALGTVRDFSEALAVESMRIRDKVLGKVFDYGYTEDWFLYPIFHVENLTSELIVPDWAEILSESSFRGSNSVVEKVVIGKNLIDIQSMCFKGFSRLKTVELNSKLALIGKQAFYGTDIVDICLPDTLEYIGSSAFTMCRSLKSVKFPNNLSEIGSSVFNGCSKMESLVLSENLMELPEKSFNGCASLRSVTIPGRCETIGESAFCNCDGMKELIIENGCTYIESCAFQGCDALERITIPASVKEIALDAFSGASEIAYTAYKVWRDSGV